MSANDQIRLRLTDARVALNLTPGQAAAWQAYENLVIEILSGSGRATEVSSGGNALAQIDRHVAVEQSRATAMIHLADSARTLYSTLTDEQKRIADRVLAGTVPIGSVDVAPVARGGR